MNKLSSEPVSDKHCFTESTSNSWVCQTCGKMPSDAAHHNVQDVDRCVDCHHSDPLDAEGYCLVDVRHVVDPEGPFQGQTTCGCKCVFPSPSVPAEGKVLHAKVGGDNRSMSEQCGFCGVAPGVPCFEVEFDPEPPSVSEAAPKPERIWMHMEDGDCWCSYHFDPNDDRNLTEYARVHQPPEQNSGKVLFGELWMDAQGEAHFVCHTKDDDFLKTKGAFQKFIALLETQIRNEKECPFYSPITEQNSEDKNSGETK